jgi:hypothetical protein
LSAEAWLGEELAGGMYGILIGGVFFGESMFSHYTNASKFAFIHLRTAVGTKRRSIDRLPGIHATCGAPRRQANSAERLCHFA